MLGVPVLAGSCAYAVAEAEGWRGSLERHAAPRPALLRRGGGLDAGRAAPELSCGFDAVTMLFWSAVVNGVLAPPLIVLVVLLTSDRTGHGQARQPAAPAVARVGHGGHHDRGDGGDARDAVNLSLPSEVIRGSPWLASY